MNEFSLAGTGPYEIIFTCTHGVKSCTFYEKMLSYSVHFDMLSINVGNRVALGHVLSLKVTGTFKRFQM